MFANKPVIEVIVCLECSAMIVNIGVLHGKLTDLIFGFISLYG